MPSQVETIFRILSLLTMGFGPVFIIVILLSGYRIHPMKAEEISLRASSSYFGRQGDTSGSCWLLLCLLGVLVVTSRHFFFLPR